MRPGKSSGSHVYWCRTITLLVIDTNSHSIQQIGHNLLFTSVGARSSPWIVAEAEVRINIACLPIKVFILRTLFASVKRPDYQVDCNCESFIEFPPGVRSALNKISGGSLTSRSGHA